MSTIIAGVIYWVIFFVVCYVVTEYGQNYLYDETTPALGLKLAGGTLLLAILSTILRPSYETMFTEQIPWTILHAICWFLVFMLIFRFHPKHALALGLGTMLIAAGMASLGVDSLTGNVPEAARREIRKNTKPIRKPSGSGAPPPALKSPGSTPKASEGEAAKSS
jgi:hypothetical protein